MCGIFGYAGKKNAVRISLEGLRKLEYRGYDSAGIAGIRGGEIHSCREVGKVAALEEEVKSKGLSLDIAIAHTRWATHGRPSVRNAHPQFDHSYDLALIHNGIIDNYDILRKNLESKGIYFRSETDTEVIANQIAALYQGDIVAAVQETVALLKGAFAFSLVHRHHPDMIIAVANECPLVIGIGKEEFFLSSDPNAFINHTKEVFSLSNGEVVVLSAQGAHVYDQQRQQVKKTTHLLDIHDQDLSKGQFKHYMLKEIHEQPTSLRNAMLHRMIPDEGTAVFEEMSFSPEELRSFQQILILACGTSFHAGLIASYMLESKVKIPVKVEIASEFRYRAPVVLPNTLVIGVSQSGETADTLAAIKEVKYRGCKVLGICNVQGSALAREADCCLFLRAGPEIGVASTKTFTNQVAILSLFALMLGRLRGEMTLAEGIEFIKCFKQLPEQVGKILHLSPAIKAIAQKYAHFHDFLFVGRNVMYPTCLEGALKLKEISYANANGYPSGEMKHGPIALVNENCLTVALTCNAQTLDKVLSNLMTIKARNGRVLVFAQEGTAGLNEIADDLVLMPPTIDELAPILSAIATQILAYEIAHARGAEIDQPRNLAKSVTVE
jgi:glucosamine--fructose-6-phosphate aminotransferase (isomerizing)